MKYDIEFIKVDDLHPYEKNAKKHPQEQIDYIKNSIKEFGFRQNITRGKNASRRSRNTEADSLMQ